jgi:hypothetical protein
LYYQNRMRQFRYGVDVMIQRKTVLHVNLSPSLFPFLSSPSVDVLNDFFYHISCVLSHTLNGCVYNVLEMVAHTHML